MSFIVRFAGLAALAVAAVVVAPVLVSADRTYHSTQIPFEAVGDEPLAGGFVENIHASGPNIYAHEVYTLRGAEGDTAYEVRLFAYLFAPDCSGNATDFGAVSLATNIAGNGRADRFFAPTDVPEALRHATHGVRWAVQRDGETVYETACSVITLD